jgi:hypothetical protein
MEASSLPQRQGTCGLDYESPTNKRCAQQRNRCVLNDSARAWPTRSFAVEVRSHHRGARVVASVFYASLMLKIFKVIRFGMRDQDAREVIAATLGLLAFGTVW